MRSNENGYLVLQLDCLFDVEIWGKDGRPSSLSVQIVPVYPAEKNEMFFIVSPMRIHQFSSCVPNSSLSDKIAIDVRHFFQSIQNMIE